MKDMVTELRRDRGGYRVTVNDTETFRLSNADFEALPLADGQALDWEQYKHDLLLRQYPEALNRAVGYLAARMRSTGEVERKLIGRGYLPDTVEMVLYKLEKESLLDDAAFANAWARTRAARQLGRARILMELRGKGVANDVAEAAVAALDEDEQADAVTALAVKLLKRYDSLSAPETLRKSLAAMQRRGYSYGEASRALQRAAEENGDE